MVLAKTRKSWSRGPWNRCDLAPFLGIYRPLIPEMQYFWTGSLIEVTRKILYV